jgi:hypothetical protein
MPIWPAGKPAGCSILRGGAKLAQVAGHGGRLGFRFCYTNRSLRTRGRDPQRPPSGRHGWIGHSSLSRNRRSLWRPIRTAWALLLCPATGPPRPRRMMTGSAHAILAAWPDRHQGPERRRPRETRHSAGPLLRCSSCSFLTGASAKQAILRVFAFRGHPQTVFPVITLTLDCRAFGEHSSTSNWSAERCPPVLTKKRVHVASLSIPASPFYQPERCLCHPGGACADGRGPSPLSLQ